MEYRKMVLMNLFAVQQQRCRHREQTYWKRAVVGRKERVEQMETHILPYVKKTANGNLLYELGNSNQSSVTTYSYGKGWEVGRRFKREGTHVSYG